MVACHNDGSRANPRLTNLRWDTQKSNVADARRHGTLAVGSRCNSKLTEPDVLEIRRLRAEGVPIGEMASRFGVTKQNIQAIVSGRTWRHLPLFPDRSTDLKRTHQFPGTGDCEAA
jgi:hypothetical protein